MIYNVVLVSGVQQSDSVIHIHISILFRFFSHIGYNKFQVYNTVLLTIVTILYIRFSELIHLITESLHPLTNTSQFHLCPQPINNYYSVPVSMNSAFVF